MNNDDKLILGTLAGVDLILSPEHYEEYKDTLNKQLEEKDKELDRLNNIINELEKWCNECIDYNIISRKNGYTTISDEFFEIVLDKLKELKENNK